MALLWMDGFDHYGLDETNMTDGAWAEIGGELSTVNPRTGTHAFKFSNNQSGAGELRRVFGGAKTTVGVGGVWWFAQLPSSNDTCRIYSFNDAANNIQVSLLLQSTGVLEVRSTSFVGTSLGATASPVIVAEAYQHIECQVFISSGSPLGEVEVRVNGVTVLSIVGVNTDPRGTGEVSQVKLGRADSIFDHGINEWYVDDVFAYDDAGSYNNDFIGDRRVLTLFPNADTAEADWSWSTGGTGYTNIDEADPNDDTDYIFANPGSSPVDISEFGLDDLPAGVSTVSAVSLVTRSRKTDAGTANLQASAVSGAGTADGADRALTEAYTYYHDIVEVDPDTSAPFTPSAVDAMKLRVTRTA